MYAQADLLARASREESPERLVAQGLAHQLLVIQGFVYDLETEGRIALETGGAS